MRIFYVALFLSVITAVVACAGGNKIKVAAQKNGVAKTDSTLWNQLNDDDRALLVVGLEDGSDGACANAIAGGAASADIVISCPRYSKNYGTYVSGISDFYAKYPAAAVVPVGLVITCLSDTPLQSCEKISKQASVFK
jgi:hypothetical protein